MHFADPVIDRTLATLAPQLATNQRGSNLGQIWDGYVFSRVQLGSLCIEKCP